MLLVYLKKRTTSEELCWDEFEKYFTWWTKLLQFSLPSSALFVFFEIIQIFLPFFFFFFLVSAKDLFVYFFNLLIGTGDREATDLEVKWEDATHISRYQIWCTVDDYVFFLDKTYLCITSCTPEKLIHVPWKALWESTTFALSCVSNFRFLTCTLQSVAWKIHYQSKLVKFSIFHIFWDIAFLKSTL